MSNEYVVEVTANGYTQVNMLENLKLENYSEVDMTKYGHRKFVHKDAPEPFTKYFGELK